MPKVKTCKAVCEGVKFEANLNVDSKGVFSIVRPGTNDDWPKQQMKISGTLADEVEHEWIAAVRELSQRSKTERKMLAVRFDSTLRKGGKRDHFVDRNVMILLECAVCMETTIARGENVIRLYREHPDYTGLHSPEQPFPVMMRLDGSDLSFRADQLTFVEWSQELQDLLVRACEGVKGVVRMLDGVLSTPESLALAASSGMAFLTAPHSQSSEASPSSDAIE